MMNQRIEHQVISASAGSGKTFQLAHRYIRLLANGVKPERIIALTFSRKAAGEIFDSIIKYLRLAASSEEKARQTAELIEDKTLSQYDFLHMLKNILEHLHRLHISTIDSFNISVIQAFPLELGIPSRFQIMESNSAAASTVQQQVLGHIFNTCFVDRSAQNEFLEAFKQATYGQNEKTLTYRLDKFIDGYRQHYRLLPDQNGWGNRNTIWPEGSPWLDPPGNIPVIAEELRRLLDQDQLNDNAITRWHAFIDTASHFNASSIMNRNIEYMMEKLLEDVDGLQKGKPQIKIGHKTYALSKEESQLALELLTHIINTLIEVALEQTRGIYRVLNQYESLYASISCRQGKLTFDDVHYLLSPANHLSGGRFISRIDEQNSRLYIDYRLDCRLDHWLLDEFQDTSDLQWEALSNLADEILQDTSGLRSFFCVGDIKQAIYRWRGGNSQIFSQILESYADVIQQRPLSTSFRSAQPIIDTVNNIFSQLPSELPTGTINQWERIWQKHSSQQGFVPADGYTCLLEPSYNGTDKPGEESRYLVASKLLNQMQPIERGLSTAILVRSNESGRKIVNYLRSHCPDTVIVHEGKSVITASPPVALLLSLIQFAAHPGDMFAWRHLQMSPLNAYLTRKKLERKHLSRALLKEIQSTGFGEFIRQWKKILCDAQSMDKFGNQRIDDLIEVASEFDSSGKPNCDAFLHFADHYRINDIATENAVRVMTIHQSKGLGFDIVILPDLQQDSIIKAKNLDIAISRNPLTNKPQWALKMPVRLIAENDPVLAEQLKRDNETYCFDELCVLYVAMTRAKQAMYLITSHPGKASQKFSAATLLKTQLCNDPKPVGGKSVSIDHTIFTCLFETGSPDWYTRTAKCIPTRQSEVSVKPSIDFTSRTPRRSRMIRITPSEQIQHEQNAGELFSDSHYQDMEMGTAVHELFSKIQWIEECNIDEIITEWRSHSIITEELKTRVIEHFRHACTCEPVKSTLSKSEINTDLWREQGFSVIKDNQWITGVFDRVAIVYDSERHPLKATIIDFKTDGITSELEIANRAKNYRPQLLAYRMALSQILRIDAENIDLRLLFTHPGIQYDLI